MISASRTDQTYLVTGATGFLGRRLVTQLLGDDEAAHVIAMARPMDPQQEETQRYIAVHADDAFARVEWITGDITQPMLGLDEARLAVLAATGELNVVHLAALYDLEVDEGPSKALTLDGAVRAYELAVAIRRHPERGDRPVRFCQTSTLAVAGTYDGEFGETGEELPLAAGKHTDWYSRHKYEAELALRRSAAGDEVPLMIARPGATVGDSTTGAIEKLDGAYCLLEYLRWPGARHFLPLSGRESFWIVPGDFVTRAMAALAANPGAYGHTFNLLYPPADTPIWCDLVDHTRHILRSRSYTGGGMAGLLAAIRYGWRLPLSLRALIWLSEARGIGPLTRRMLSGMGIVPQSLRYAVDNPRYVVENYQKFGVDPPAPWRDVWRACVLYYRDHRDEMKAGALVAHQKDD